MKEDTGDMTLGFVYCTESLFGSAFCPPQGEWSLSHTPNAMAFCVTMSPKAMEPRTTG